MEQIYVELRAENKNKEIKILNKECIELIKELGEGTYGSVYLGKCKYQMKNNKKMMEVSVAVKVLDNKMLEYEQVRRVFFSAVITILFKK